MSMGIAHGCKLETWKKFIDELIDLHGEKAVLEPRMERLAFYLDKFNPVVKDDK